MMPGASCGAVDPSVVEVLRYSHAHGHGTAPTAREEEIRFNNPTRLNLNGMLTKAGGPGPSRLGKQSDLSAGPRYDCQ
jgi:hypothetical protein